MSAGRPKGNFSIAWAGAVTNDAASGSVAWTNPSNAGLQDDSWATASLTNNDTQYLKATNFNLIPSIPATATIIRLSPVVKGKRNVTSPSITDAEIKFIKSGVISGNSFSNGSELGSSQNVGSQRNTVYYGRDNDETGGLSWSYSDLTNDTNFGFAYRVQSTGTATASVDALGLMVYWQDTPSAVCTAKSPTTGQPSGTFINVDAHSSIIGDSSWERVGFRWTIKGPDGWSMTTLDPRRGTDINGISHKWSTDLTGRTISIYADRAGSYKFFFDMYLENGSVLRSNVVTVIIDAKATTKRYLKPSSGNNGNDGLTENTAWQTWSYALTNTPNDCTLILVDDETINVTSTSSKSNWTRVLVTRSNTGTNRPTFNISASQALGTFTGDVDLVFKDINFGDYTAYSESTVPYLINGYSHTRLGIINCIGDRFNSVVEITSLGSSDGIFIINNNLGNFRRYVLFAGGDRVKNVVIAGNIVKSATTTGGEAAIRLAAATTIDCSTGYGANIFWNTAQYNQGVANAQSFVRVGWSGVDIWANRVDKMAWAYAEGANGDTVVSHIMGNRFDGNDITQSNVSITNQRNSFGSFFCNQFFDEMDRPWIASKALDSLNWIQIANTTWKTTTGTTSIVNIENADGTTNPGDIWGLEFKNSLFIAGSSWNSTWFRDPSSQGTFGSRSANISRNVYNKAASTNWRNAGTSLNLSSWNALSTVANEAAESTLTLADIDASTNWLPSSGFTTARTNASPEPGVYWDYRFVNRDNSAITWSTGCTGTESVPSAPSFTITPGSSQNTLVLGSIGSLLKRSIFRSLTFSGPYNWIAETTSSNFVDNLDDNLVANGLTNGVTYYYVVVNIDSIRNVSPFSSEMSGTPSSEGKTLFIGNRSGTPYFIFNS